MEFHYRYVGFGSTFVAGKEPRVESDAAADARRGPKTLGPNEIAVDVGGRCLGYDGEELAVFDHHFRRAGGGQFPSAAAAVLHHAQAIFERFHNQPSLWLVAHREPDFDAFCAMYLARQIVSGAIPHEGWMDFGVRTTGWFDGREEIDWFSPHVEGLPLERRWPILLAAYASRVDESRRLNCARDRAIHAVLYAAIHRGRELLAMGAHLFFEEVRRAISERHLNPLFDSLLDNSAEFAPELALLDRENRAYARDITRARKAIVYLQESPMDTWYPKAVETPLFNPDGTVNSYHLDCGRKNLRQADGIYIRDPECLLFKEWARSDIENSSSRQGFLFTAIADSNDRQTGSLNNTNYFFSLDPERAGHAHLYNLWAYLQTKECFAIRQTSTGAGASAVQPRAIVAARAAGFEQEFADPWFDGGNYHCTIIATPNDGTQIAPPGTRADLYDDPIAQIARDALELAVFEGNLHVQDIPAACEAGLPPVKVLPAAVVRAQLTAPPSAFYRFVSVSVSDDINFQNPAVAEQIGQFLWQLLINDSTVSMPADFIQRHLVIEHSTIGVWNRKGIAIAYRASGADNAAQTGIILQSLIALACRTEVSLKLPPDQRLEALDGNLREALTLKQKLALPDFRILTRFYEASRLDEVLSASHDLDLAHSDRRRSDEMNKALKEIEGTQKKVEWVEVFIIAVYATELARAVTESFANGQTVIGWSILVLAFLAMPAAIMALNLGPELRHSLRDTKQRKRFIGIVVWAGLFLLLLIVAMLNREPEKLAPVDRPPATQTAPHP